MMDARDRQALDNWITGGGYSEEVVQHRCPHCLNIEQVHMYSEYGGWFYVNEDDTWCSECDIEMDIWDDNTSSFKPLSI